MPKFPSVLNPLSHADPPQFLRRLSRLHCLLHLMRLPTGVQAGLHISRMHQHDRYASVLQIHRHALPDIVEGRLGGAVGVRATGAVVCDAADAGGHESDTGMRREQERGEQCLGEEERAKGVCGEGAEENAVGGVCQTVLLVRGHDACKVNRIISDGI